MQRELEIALFTAWQTARLTNYSGNRLRPLRDVLDELKGPQQRRGQTAEEMIEAMRIIRATMGG